MNTHEEIIQTLTAAGIEATHWGERLIDAATSNKTAKDLTLAHIANMSDAKDWTTCACGKADDGIPRNADGVPHDPTLRLLGQAFYTSVASGRYLSAAECLVNIEARAGQVMQERLAARRKVAVIFTGAAAASTLGTEAIISAARNGRFLPGDTQKIAGIAAGVNGSLLPMLDDKNIGLLHAVRENDAVAAAQWYVDRECSK